MQTDQSAAGKAGKLYPLPQWTNKIVHNSTTVVCDFFKSESSKAGAEKALRQALPQPRGVSSYQVVYRPEDNMAFLYLKRVDGAIQYTGFWRVEANHMELIRNAAKEVLSHAKEMPYDVQKLHGLDGSVHRVLSLVKHNCSRHPEYKVVADVAALLKQAEAEHESGKRDLYHSLEQQKLALSLVEKKPARAAAASTEEVLLYPTGSSVKKIFGTRRVLASTADASESMKEQTAA